jgi:hypothetical protein
MICCGMALKRMGMLGVWRRRHWLCWWRKQHWLVKMDRIWHALCMKLIVKYCFIADVLFLEGTVLDLDKYIFPWHTCFLEGCLRLGSSFIWVHIVYQKSGSRF